MITELFSNIVINPPPYEDLTGDGCILYPEQYSFLCKISVLLLIVSLYGLYKKHYDIALINFGVFLTSIMYWCKPTNCWRKTLDVTYVKFAFFYNILRAINSEYSIIYFITLIISIFFYQLGVYLYNKKLYWESTYAHSMVHIFANLSYIILYTGYVKPLSDYCK